MTPDYHALKAERAADWHGWTPPGLRSLSAIGLNPCPRRLAGRQHQGLPCCLCHRYYGHEVMRLTRLVAGDTNKAQDIFVRDRLANVTALVSVGRHETQANEWSYGPSISADGQYVAFTSRASNLLAHDTNLVRDVFFRNRGGAS